MADVTKEKINRKDQILLAARKLFSQKGYLATSMRDLAENLGIEAASLYSHISSKDHLLWSIANKCAEDFISEVTPIANGNLNTLQKLRSMIVAHVVVITRNQDAAAIFFNEWKYLEGNRKIEYAKIRDDYEDHFRQVVRKGIEENLFRNFDERFTARAILSSLNWTHTWYRSNGELKPEAIGKNLADILLDGLIRNR